MRLWWHWKRMLGMLWIGWWLSISGCAATPLEPLDATDSVQCKKDCVSVTKGFVLQRLMDLEQIIILQADLRNCQHQLAK